VIYFARLSAAALGVAGWLVYIYFWLLVRFQGFVVFDFGIYYSKLEWFENWIEPFFLIGILVLTIWSFLYHMIRGVPNKGE